MPYHTSPFDIALARQAAQSADRVSELRLSDTQAPHLLISDLHSGNRVLWQWQRRTRSLTPLSPADWDISSRVNGYGGGAYALLGDAAVVVNRRDQCLYRLEANSRHPFFSRHGSDYGGLVSDPLRQRILAVEEDVQAGESRQRLVAISTAGRQVLADGADFYGAPTVSPNGHYLAFVEWALPDMPWQSSRLRVCRVKSDGYLQTLRVDTPPGAVTQPQFTADGRLICMSDQAGYWQPFEVAGERWRCLSDVAVDHAATPWQLGDCQHAWWPGGGAVMRFRDGWGCLEGACHQDRWQGPTGRIISVAANRHGIYALTQGPAHSTRLVHCRHDGSELATLFETDPLIAPLSPQRLQAQVGQGGRETVSAFVYPASREGPAPLIMRVHGGPTSASYPVYDPLIAWWQTLGYAVADLNPRGSANQGRAFRQRLAREWGTLDVEDALAMAKALVAGGIADPKRLFIRGQSAGGFTVLNVLAESRTFCAGASLYGVTDAARLASLTHRFESGYLDWLIGDDDAKRTASPLHRLGQQPSAPVLFLQGEDDGVVVASQTLDMADRLRKSGHHAEVLLFVNEGHGIRHPLNRLHMIQREARFFAQCGMQATR